MNNKSVIDHIVELEKQGIDGAEISIQKIQPDSCYEVLRKLQHVETGEICWLCRVKK